MAQTFSREQVEPILRKCWSIHTSGNWLPGNPAQGQCNVTALLVRANFGGEILKTRLPDGDHFYNLLNGQRVDLTDSQFNLNPAVASRGLVFLRRWFNFVV